jgi:hypothetical protein
MMSQLKMLKYEEEKLAREKLNKYDKLLKI